MPGCAQACVRACSAPTPHLPCRETAGLTERQSRCGAPSPRLPRRETATHRARQRANPSPVVLQVPPPTQRKTGPRARCVAPSPTSATQKDSRPRARQGVHQTPRIAAQQVAGATQKPPRVDLCDVKLCDFNLCDVNLCDVNLCDVNLCDVNLCDVNLGDVNLCDVNLSGCNLCDEGFHVMTAVSIRLGVIYEAEFSPYNHRRVLEILFRCILHRQF